MIGNLLAAVALLVACVLVHEEGHYLAARCLRYPAKFKLRGVKWGSDDVLSPPSHRMIVAAAGPLASFLFFFEALELGWSNLAVATLLMAVVNIIPFKYGDGRNIINALEAMRG